MAWPTHPDGTNKTVGEMTPAEKREVMKAAADRFKAQREENPHAQQ